jgi:hypothetical protein
MAGKRTELTRRAAPEPQREYEATSGRWSTLLLFDFSIFWSFCEAIAVESTDGTRRYLDTYTEEFKQSTRVTIAR